MHLCHVPGARPARARGGFASRETRVPGRAGGGRKVPHVTDYLSVSSVGGTPPSAGVCRRGPPGYAPGGRATDAGPDTGTGRNRAGSGCARERAGGASGLSRPARTTMLGVALCADVEGGLNYPGTTRFRAGRGNPRRTCGGDGDGTETP